MNALAPQQPLTDVRPNESRVNENSYGQLGGGQLPLLDSIHYDRWKGLTHRSIVLHTLRNGNYYLMIQRG